jgi:hypothetical protein
MGLLDDAIREHLDLQRRRGADPTDVERAEREALGPVRRAPEGAEQQHELAPGLESEPGFAYDQAGEEGWDGEPPIAKSEYAEDAGDHGLEPTFEPRDPAPERAYSEPVEPAVAPVEPDAAPVVPDAAPVVPSPPSEEPYAAGYEPDAAGEEPYRVPTVPPPPASSGSVSDAATGDETVEYDVERALGNDESDEDVLEETPEFLQDTPDHDRLWFEQRPPRDFDFDG